MVIVTKNLCKLFVNCFHGPDVSSPVVLDLSHELSDWHCKDSYNRLIPSLEDIVKDHTAEVGAVKRIGRKRDVKVHGGVDCGVVPGSLGLGLDVLDRR